VAETVIEAPLDGLGEPVPATAVQPRALVPSTREQDLGIKAADYSFYVPQDGQATRPSARQALSMFAQLSDPRNIDGPKWPLVVLGIVGFNGAIDTTGVTNLLPNIQSSFGVDLSFLVTFSAIVGIITALLAPPMGYLADRIPRVWMVRVGGIIGAASTLLQGLAPGTTELVLGRATGGIGAGISSPPSYPLFTDYYPLRARARVIAIFAMITAIGGILGPTVSGHLADAFGWRATLDILGISAVVASLFTFLLREPVRGYYDRLEMGASEELATKEQAPVSFSEGWRAASSIATLRRLWILFPILAIASWGVTTLMPLYYAEIFALSPGARGNLTSLSLVAGLFGLMASGVVGDRLLAHRPSRLLIIGGLLLVAQAGIFVILGLSPWLWLSFAVSLPLGFIGSMLLPSLLMLVSLVVPSRIRGFGIQSGTWFQLIGLVGLVILAPLLNVNDMRNAFFLLVPITLIGAAVIGTAAPGMARDIRAATAASVADEEAERARKSGRNKLVICRDVDVTYDGVQVLFNVDFDVDDGEIIALLGTNGAGKSTLLRAIAGVQQASNGAIFLDGQDITHLPPHEAAERGVVMMPGGQAVFPTMTVEENLRTAAWMYREDGSYVTERMAAVYEMFPVLNQRKGTAAGNLSGGEQQMVGLAQAFLMKPRLLMVDELSLGLAPKVVEQLLDTLRTIHDQGTTVILVEQSLNVALTIAERAVFMEKGEIRFDGPTQELLRRPDLIRSVFMGGRTTRPTIKKKVLGTETLSGRLLEVNDVSVSFGGLRALTDVDLHVSPGEVVGMIGPNGAGKTTIFDIISGFVTPDGGSVFLDGHDLTELPPDARGRRGLGRSFQNARLFPALTVRENIATMLERRAVRSAIVGALWLPVARRSEEKIARRVDDLIELMGLDPYADKFVSELSTGTRRAVDVACMMAVEPKLLLLDEPSSGLAQAETEELGPVLLRLAHDTGCGVLIIEHDLPLVTSISDRLVALELGKVIATGTPNEVVNDKRVLAAYLSASEDVLARSNATMSVISNAVLSEAPAAATGRGKNSSTATKEI
jgi:branched-chain amino acid transport system ATP-binding protein